MIPQEKLEEIKELLQSSENPLFFFDDDPDGLCSYLLFKKFIQRGEGIVIKSYPSLDINFLKKVRDYNPDKIFVFDKPIITQDFVDNAKVPVIWIDHHPIINIKGVKYYNPKIEDEKDGRPVTYWCYKVVKQNLWIALCGCISDWFYPEDLIKDFKKEYPKIVGSSKDPGFILFNSELGKLSRIFSFILKGQIKDVKKCLNIVEKINDPYEILEQKNENGGYIFKRYEKINAKYQELLNKSLQVSDDKILVFIYTADKMSFTNDLSNELIYRFPEKLIIVGREKDEKIRISLRSQKYILPKMLEKALKNVDGYGGGHKHACGGNISKRDFDKFISNIKAQI